MRYDLEPHRFVDVGHSQLAYRRYGHGPDVVFIHGWPLHSATYRKLADAMAQQFTCHLFDLPGAGASKVTDVTRYDLRSHAHTMRRAIDAVGLERHALVAHDSGGVVARFMAADEPRRVTGLVLSNTELPHYRSLLLRMLIGVAKTGVGRSALTLALASRWYRRSEMGFGACFEDRDLIDGEFHELFIAPIMRDPARAKAQMRLAESFDWSQIDELGRVQQAITAPVKLIWGADDPYFPLEPARAMGRELGWDLEVLRPGKLFVHEERPDDIARIATPFLERAFADAAEARPAATA